MARESNFALAISARSEILVFLKRVSMPRRVEIVNEIDRRRRLSKVFSRFEKENPRERERKLGTRWTEREREIDIHLY